MGLTRCTFEASEFWRRILLNEFPVIELRVDCDNYSVFLWKHRLYETLISTPFRDRLALAWHGPKPPHINLSRLQDQISSNLLARGKSKRILLKDVMSYLTVDEHNLNTLSQSHINCDVQLDDKMFERLNRSSRKNLRKAREDYGLRFFVNKPGMFDEFIRLYLQTRKRLGVAPYRRSFFRRIFDAVGEKTFVFSCCDNEDNLGFLICYAHDNELISAHIAYDYEKRQMKVPDFLYLNAFAWGQENGFCNYRFGGDYNSQDSLIRSKIKLGAVPRKQMDFVVPVGSSVQKEPSPWICALLTKVPSRVYPSVGLVTLVHFQ